MLQITIPSIEEWDEEKQEFIYPDEKTLTLEHSLVSLSKWESKWHKPFIHKDDKTSEEFIDYIKCMTLDSNVDSEVYNRLTNENISQINKYINDSMTATFFSDDKRVKKYGEIITAELIYYWMITCGVPFECENWHLNRLLTLIRVCNTMNTPKKKKSIKEIMSRNAAINEARKQKLKTRG